MKYGNAYHIFIRDSNGKKLYLKKEASADWTVLTTTTNKAEATNLVFRNDRNPDGTFNTFRPYYAMYGAMHYTSLELETPHNNGDYLETYLVHHIMNSDMVHTFLEYNAYFEGETVQHFNHPNLIGSNTDKRQWFLFNGISGMMENFTDSFEIGATIMSHPYSSYTQRYDYPNFRLTYVNNYFKIVNFNNWTGYTSDRNATFYLEHPTDTTKFDH